MWCHSIDPQTTCPPSSKSIRRSNFQICFRSKKMLSRQNRSCLWIFADQSFGLNPSRWWERYSQISDAQSQRFNFVNPFGLPCWSSSSVILTSSAHLPQVVQLLLLNFDQAQNLLATTLMCESTFIGLLLTDVLIQVGREGDTKHARDFLPGSFQDGNRLLPAATGRTESGGASSDLQSSPETPHYAQRAAGTETHLLAVRLWSHSTLL